MRKIRIHFYVQWYFLLMFIFASLTAISQEINEEAKRVSLSPFLNVNKDKMFMPFVVVETWATYSMGEAKNGIKYADRGDVSLRRLRMGAKGTPYSWLKYNFHVHFDRLGEDESASTKGSYKGLGLWNAYLTIKLIKSSEWLHLHAGYFWAAISREYNTCPWAVGSFDKVQAAWYLRSFVTATGNGIESGLALGGLKNYERFGISYRLGTYEPKAYASSKYASRLYTARVMFSFGDAEESTYKYMLSGNQWRKRNGITLGFGASTQANGKLNETRYFNKSISYGADVLIDYEGLRIDAEYFLLNRTATGYNDFEGRQGHLRVGYSFIINNKFVEPVVCYDNYEGKGEKVLFKHIGDDNTLDIGVNWYLDKDKLKLSLHYVMQDGSASSNNGDYIGMACQFKL